MLLALKHAYCVLYQIPNLNSSKKQRTVTKTYTGRESRDNQRQTGLERYTKYLCIPIYTIF